MSYIIARLYWNGWAIMYYFIVSVDYIFLKYYHPTHFKKSRIANV